jgi:hypothetical protein
MRGAMPFFQFLRLDLLLSYHGRIIYITDREILTEMVLILFYEVHDIASQVLSLGHYIRLIDTF